VKPVLFVFVKAPIMGAVKTRLAAGIGRVHARRVYRSMCGQVFRKCTDPRWQTVLYVTPDRCVDKHYGGLWPHAFPRFVQGAGDLSDRSARIFKHKGPVMAIGTDTPQFAARDIADGFKALKTHKAVFGPADDGGFWLIGFRGPVRPEIFDNIRWSHTQTLADMMGNIDGPIATIRSHFDIDDRAAYERLKAL